MTKNAAQMGMFGDNGPVLRVRQIPTIVTMDELVAEIRPRQYRVHMYGQSMARPRLEAWVHDDQARGYKFGGGAPMRPQPWTPLLSAVLYDVESITREHFDSCFVNYYRHGNDSIAWHSDSAPGIGPVIASVSLGATRTMLFRRRTGKRGATHRLRLAHRDLLVMPRGFQALWEHSIPKVPQAKPRLNLTFRQTVESA